MTAQSAGRKAKPRPARLSRRNVIGGFLDDRCPPLVDVLAQHNIDPAAFEAWLGPRLGDFRFAEPKGEPPVMPARTAELAILTRMGEALDAAARELAEGPGPRGEVHVELAAVRLGLGWSQLAKRLQLDLALASGILRDARDRVETRPQKTGRPPRGARDNLLRAIVARLRDPAVRTPVLSARQAYEIAGAVLQRCGIGVPSDERAARRVVKRKG